MKIRQIEIKNFRGIKNMKWDLPDQNIYCLIGPGDSTKSTILDAIELALSPRWNISIYDTDFYECQINQPIHIYITIGDLSDKLRPLHKFGKYLRGWKKDELVDEPHDGYEEVITIHFFVDESLEPNWTLFTERNLEDRIVSSRDRELIGMARIGTYLDRHLSWSRGSSLSHLTESTNSVLGVLVQAARQARDAVTNENLPDLSNAAKQTEQIVQNFGVKPHYEFHPAIDPQSTNENSSTIALFDGKVPLRQRGLGTRRLITIAMQQHCASGSIQLIDEIEYGLEPHRIHQLLNQLSKIAHPGCNENNCQILITTHSQIAIEELTTKEIFIVRSTNGTTKLLTVSMDLQKTIRSESVALLGKKVIVCEGKTELGICRELNKRWSENGNLSFACLGVVPVDGGGDAAPERAIDLANLGYIVSYFADSDKVKPPRILDMKNHGIDIFIWEDSVCTEQRLFNDLPVEALQELLNISALHYSETTSFFQHLNSYFSNQLPKNSLMILDWMASSLSEQTIRSTLGLAAKNKDHPWFKRIDLGEELGRIIFNYLPKIEGTDLFNKIEQLRRWIDA